MALSTPRANGLSVPLLVEPTPGGKKRGGPEEATPPDKKDEPDPETTPGPEEEAPKEEEPSSQCL